MFADHWHFFLFKKQTKNYGSEIFENVEHIFCVCVSHFSSF